jgi:hypothetical protein
MADRTVEVSELAKYFYDECAGPRQRIRNRQRSAFGGESS